MYTNYTIKERNADKFGVLQSKKKTWNRFLFESKDPPMSGKTLLRKWIGLVEYWLIYRLTCKIYPFVLSRREYNAAVVVTVATAEAENICLKNGLLFHELLRYRSVVVFSFIL